MTVVAWISGHGFGHWTRSSALLSLLAAEQPVHVRTAGRALPLAQRATWAASVEPFDVGPGVVQRGPLEVDVPATREALEAHMTGWEETAAAGARDAKAVGADLVFADVPPIAFEVARRAGLPSVAMANFTWSWAYEHYAGDDGWFADVAGRLRAAESLATAALPLTGGGGLDAIGAGDAERLALRRAPTCSRSEARASLRALVGEGDTRPLALLSFGGYGDDLDLSAAARQTPGWTFVSFAPADDPPENLRVLPHDHDLHHQDLVLGADALIAKPGYGTVSECLNGPTPLAYVVPSGAFREHTELLGMIQRWLPCAPLAHDALLAGRWEQALRSARLATPREPAPPNDLSGALALLRRHLSR